MSAYHPLRVDAAPGLSRGLALLLVAFAGHAAAQDAPAASTQASRQPGGAQVAQAWIRDVFGPNFLPPPSGGDYLDRAPPSSPRARARPRAPAPVGTYRTRCVRLCDGYYWPVSFTATRGEFARDSKTCEQSCDLSVALHVYRNPGEEPEDMVDLQGRPYTMLDSAFRYRGSYNPACKCRPQPWEEASRQRHLSYKISAQADAGTTEKR